MGLFDSIICELPLPNIPDDTYLEDLQTKCLGRGMETYTITKNGELVKNNYKKVVVPIEERPHYNSPEFAEKWLVESVKYVADGFEPTDFTGSLNFYTFTDVNLGGGGEWWEFEAIFEKGYLMKMSRRYDG